MAFLTLGDEKGMTIECIVFPKVYDQYKSYLIKDTVIIVDGHIDTKNEKPMVIVKRIFPTNHLMT